MDVEKFSLKGTVLNIADRYCRDIVNKLSPVAFSGDYNDLSNKPIIGSASYVGMIITSSTLDTMEKVIAFYGGTEWTRLSGTFIIGASDKYVNGSTGGSEDSIVVEHSHIQQGTFTSSNESKTHAHTFTTDGAGGHKHTFQSTISTGGSTYRPYIQTGGSAGNTDTSTVANHTHNGTTNANNSNHTHNVTLSGNTSTVGSSGVGGNMPPYVAKYMWERTK